MVDLFSFEFGRLSAIARNARKSSKRFSSSVDYYRKLDIEYRVSKSFASLTSASTNIDYSSVASDLVSSAIAAYGTEFLSVCVVAGQPEPRMFDALQAFYAELSERPFGSLLSLQKIILQEIGIVGPLQGCECGNQGAIRHFSLENAVLVCESCELTNHSREIGTEAALALIGQDTQEAFSRQAATWLARVLIRQIGKPLKSQQFLKQVLALHQ